MGDKKDVYSKAKEEMRLSERILAAIPGFHGYKEKELRRESDKLIRNHLYLKLSEAKTDLRSVSQKLADRRWMDVLTGESAIGAQSSSVGVLETAPLSGSSSPNSIILAGRSGFRLKVRR